MQEDGESGLKLMGHRYYDPGTGRFITRDPIGSGTNWYRYADNNPLKNVDPDGLERVKVTKDDAYYDTVEANIESIRRNGEKGAADALEKALTEGRIYVETDPAHMMVGTKAGPVDAAAYVSTRTQELTISEVVLMKKRIGAEAVLFHESVHLREAASGLPSQEQIATSLTEAYCRRRSMQEKRRRSGDDAEWDSYAYGNVQERAQFASADRKAMLLYWMILSWRMFR